MTFTQIEKTREFMLRVDTIHGFEKMDSFVGELKAFYFMFDLSLAVYVYNTKESYTKAYEHKDKASIKSFLNSQIAEKDINMQALNIIDLINEGNNSIGNVDQMTDFISKVYFSYNDKIKFDKTTEAVATNPTDVLNFSMMQVDENMVAGIINKLRNYGMSLISQPSSKAKSNTSVVINNNNTNSATASANADIKITIEQAKQQVEDAGFGDQQYKAVMDKLAEIESITISQESKGSKWKKSKEILKWCAGQGIEIAKIVLPLLPQMLK